MPPQQLTRDSHSVPQLYLRGWSSNGTHAWGRRLLVPTPTYPDWQHRALRSLTVYSDLYTSVRSGADSDDFERWIKEDFEDPAVEPLRKARAGEALSSRDIGNLVRFAAALDVRTPASFLRSKALWEREFPRLMESSLKETRRKLRKAHKSGKRLTNEPAPRETPPLKVTIEPSQDPGFSMIRAEIVFGRELWLYSMRRVLTGAVNELNKHEWSVLEAYQGATWFTSDDPLIRLNFNSPEDFDFGGGWGNPGSEIVLPLSPKYVLYTQVAKPRPSFSAFSREHTTLLQRLIAAHAHRWLVAHEPSRRAEWFRDRVVSKEMFHDEARQWADWHHDQAQAEASLHRPNG